MKPDGEVAGNSKAQVDQAWKNVIAVLKSANMSTADLVRVNVYITDPADVELNRASWKKISKNGGPAITMVTLKRLSHPDWTVGDLRQSQRRHRPLSPRARSFRFSRLRCNQSQRENLQ